MAEAQGSGDHSAGKGPSESNLELPMWDFETDLKLVCAKLSQSNITIEEKRKLQKAIQSFLTVKDSNVDGPGTSVRFKTAFNPWNALNVPVGKTNRSIKQTICLMMQFQKEYTGQELLPRTNQTEPVSSNETTYEDAHLSGVSLRDVETVFSAFRKFFSERLDCCLDISPLENPLILTMILGYLSPKELRSVRFVSQAWSVHAASVHRKIHKPIHLTENNIGRFNTEIIQELKKKKNHTCRFLNLY